MRHLIAVVLCTGLLLGCGRDKPSPQPKAVAPTREPARQIPEPEPAAVETVTIRPDATGVVRMTGDDLMKFNANRIEVTGTSVKIELRHIGKLPKEVMGHNLVVLKPGTNPGDFSLAGASSPKTDYIADSVKGEVIATTGLVGGGQHKTIAFELPGPGTYPFVCTFPGHFATMKGELVATPAEPQEEDPTQPKSG